MTFLAKLDEYLGYLERQGEPGLIVFDDASREAPVLDSLHARGFVSCSGADEAAAAIAQGRPVLILVDERYTRALHDLVSRLGEESLARSIEETHPPRLVLLAGRKESVAEMDRRLSIMHMVGMVERF